MKSVSLLIEFIFPSRQDGVFPINNFILLFSIIYLSLALLGNLLIDFIPIGFPALIMYFTFYLCLYIGASFGLMLPKIKLPKIFNNANYFLYFLLVLISITTFWSWKIMLTKYGSLAFIYYNAYTIRLDSIGKTVSTIPVFFSYCNSFIYALFVIYLVKLKNNLNTKYIIYLLIYCFVLIVLNDLLAFGRIGILYSIFCIIGYIFYYKVKINFKRIILFLLIIFIFALPRLIRGSFDNFKASINNYEPYFKTEVPSSLNFLMTNYIYYFSSIYALSDYLNTTDFYMTNGERNFTPFYNVINRFIINENKITLIERNAKVPFSYNIYSIVKDLYTDFTYPGSIVVSLLFGLTIGFFARAKCHSISIYLIGWILYTPIYNAFSFGGFFFSFVLLIILSLIVKEI